MCVCVCLCVLRSRLDSGGVDSSQENSTLLVAADCHHYQHLEEQSGLNGHALF